MTQKRFIKVEITGAGDDKCEQCKLFDDYCTCPWDDDRLQRSPSEEWANWERNDIRFPECIAAEIGRPQEIVYNEGTFTKMMGDL